MSPNPPKRVEYEDVDDIIGIAAEMKEREANQLTVRELEDVGAELDIPKEYVLKAIGELETRRAEAERRLTLARERQRRRRRMAAWTAGVVAALLLVYGVVAHSMLSGDLAEVRARRAQVKNVIERQRDVLARYAKRPSSPDRDAMIDGAENRVRIERRRYDEAATLYNRAAGGLFASVWARLFGFPRDVPLSSSIQQW